MKDPMLEYDFRAAFNGHAFVNERGVKFRWFCCSVEYAPYQKAPKVISKKDPREGTLDKGATMHLVTTWGVLLCSIMAFSDLC